MGLSIGMPCCKTIESIGLGCPIDEHEFRWSPVNGDDGFPSYDSMLGGDLNGGGHTISDIGYGNISSGSATIHNGNFFQVIKRFDLPTDNLGAFHPSKFKVSLGQVSISNVEVAQQPLAPDPYSLISLSLLQFTTDNQTTHHVLPFEHSTMDSASTSTLIHDFEVTTFPEYKINGDPNNTINIIPGCDILMRLFVGGDQSFDPQQMMIWRTSTFSWDKWELEYEDGTEQLVESGDYDDWMGLDNDELTATFELAPEKAHRIKVTRGSTVKGKTFFTPEEDDHPFPLHIGQLGFVPQTENGMKEGDLWEIYEIGGLAQQEPDPDPNPNPNPDPNAM